MCITYGNELHRQITLPLLETRRGLCCWVRVVSGIMGGILGAMCDGDVGGWLLGGKDKYVIVEASE